MKTTTIQKWGNSYAVRLPKAALRKMQLEPGQIVEVKESANGKEFSITPLKQEDADLVDLVARISEDNRHGECDWGASVGKEVW